MRDASHHRGWIGVDPVQEITAISAGNSPFGQIVIDPGNDRVVIVERGGSHGAAAIGPLRFSLHPLRTVALWCKRKVQSIAWFLVARFPHNSSATEIHPGNSHGRTELARHSWIGSDGHLAIGR